MKTTGSALSWKAVIISNVLLVTPAAMAQPVQPPTPTGGAAQPSAVPSPTPQPTSSNPWTSLPPMSADRCLAEADRNCVRPENRYTRACQRRPRDRQAALPNTTAIYRRGTAALTPMSARVRQYLIASTLLIAVALPMSPATADRVPGPCDSSKVARRW